MSENEGTDASATKNEALRQIAAELKRFNDRFEPVPWYKLELGRPMGFGLIGLLFLIGAARDGDASGYLLIAGSIFFVAQAIAGSGFKRYRATKTE